MSDVELGVILDSHRLEVLGVLTEPLTAQEVVEKSDTSTGSVYRILEELESSGLVEVYDQTFTDPRNTKRSRRWIRTVDSVTVEFSGQVERPDETAPVWDR